MPSKGIIAIHSRQISPLIRFCLHYFSFPFRVVYLNMPLFLICITIFFLVGIIMYSYWSCDPFISKQISRMDQVKYWYS